MTDLTGIRMWGNIHPAYINLIVGLVSGPVSAVAGISCVSKPVAVVKLNLYRVYELYSIFVASGDLNPKRSCKNIERRKGNIEVV